MESSMPLSGKKIVLLVSGGIAAYKAADLTSRLKKAGADVRVVMTEAAKKFVAPLTFEAISGHPVYGQVFNEPLSYRMEHIEWARWADLAVVAPATADFIAKMTHGIADDAPLTLLLAFRGPVLVAPAMNTAMWDHLATKENIQKLKSRGLALVGPEAGDLACGEVGEGRLAQPEAILHAIEEIFAKNSVQSSSADKPLSGQSVLITAGPTREPLDPIRFISNRSTGQMGVALAAAARDLGARVILVHGPLQAPVPDGVESVPADDSLAMLKAVQDRIGPCRVAIFAAAVANYHSPNKSGQKIKGGQTLTLELVRTPDIAGWAGANRNGASQFLVGFAAESQNLMEAAQRKLTDKKLDLIFANPIGVPGVGFEAKNNTVTMLSKTGEKIDSGERPKSEIAGWIWERILERAGI
jgi:phosphopantothenoylcysteine decarboxylase/phosphopantothenate--cysteine ligase